MTSITTKAALVALFAGATAMGACSSDETKNRSGEPVVIPPVNEPDASTATEGGPGNPDGSTAPDGGVEAGPSDLGPIPVTDVPDVPCQAPGGFATEVTPASPSEPVYNVLGMVGARRFALSQDGLRFFTFAPDGGSAPSANVSDVIAAAAEGAGVATLKKSGAALVLQRYDESAAAQGGAITLAPSVDWQAIGASSTKVLAVWSKGGQMNGALLDVGGTTVTSALDLGADAAGKSTYLITIAASGAGFVVVWTRNRTDGQTETMWRRVENDGSLSAPKTLLLAAGDHGVVTTRAAASGGVLVLVEEGSPPRGAVTMRVDASGVLSGSALRMTGTSRAFGIAENSLGELGIAAQKGYQAAFRALDATGAPIGAWSCLDDAAGDAGVGFLPNGALDSDGDGYATLARAKNGASVFRRLDRTGIGR